MYLTLGIRLIYYVAKLLDTRKKKEKILSNSVSDIWMDFKTISTLCTKYMSNIN